MKTILKSFIPPVVLDLYRKSRKSVWRYSGNYSSFEEAQKNAVGYDAPEIIEKVVTSTQKVLTGEAVFERDSVLFYEEDPNYQLLFALYRIVLETGKLHLLDFGGALGSVFRQHTKLLDPLKKDFSWNIVEQESFYEASKKIKYEKELHFYRTIEETFENVQINAVLFSSVLQYLENPEEFLEKAEKAEYLIIDIHPEFTERKESAYTVQEIREPIYNASYPLRIWGKDEIKNLLSKKYILLDEWKVKSDYTQFLKDEKEMKNEVRNVGMFLKKKS